DEIDVVSGGHRRNGLPQSPHIGVIVVGCGRIDRVMESEDLPPCLVTVLGDDLIDELSMLVGIEFVRVDVDEQDACVDEPVFSSCGERKCTRLQSSNVLI